MTAVAVVDSYELDPPAPQSLSAAVGERLRGLRVQRGLSLADVDKDSGRAIKASVLGAYERGERAISLDALDRLAVFYGVPVHELIPGAPAALSQRLRSQLAALALGIDTVLIEAEKDEGVAR